MSKVVEYRKRMNTIDKVHHMVNAMQVVTISGFQKTQKKLKWAQRYRETLEQIVSEGLPFSIYLQPQDQPHTPATLLCLLSSSRGFCSGFNEGICLGVKDAIRFEKLEKKELKYLVIGKKGREALDINKKDIIYFSEDVAENPTYDNVSQMLEFILAKYASGKIDKVMLIYNAFETMFSQKIEIKQFLPLKTRRDYIDTGIIYAEPSEEIVGENLTRAYLFAVLYDAVLQSVVSELSRRLLTLKEATENSADMLKDVGLKLNKARQSIITQELSEIVSTFEILRGEE
jgi:F-type H+-transporting ATPase subunit gamma